MANCGCKIVMEKTDEFDYLYGGKQVQRERPRLDDSECRYKPVVEQTNDSLIDTPPLKPREVFTWKEKP